VLVAVGLGTGGFVGAQIMPTCGAGESDSIGVEVGKPLAAVQLTKSVAHAPDGTERPVEFIAFLARDSAGRIRIEKRSAVTEMGEEKVTPHIRDGGTTTTTWGEQHATALIFDCTNGKVISLQPGMQIARVTEHELRSSSQRSSRSYSSYFNTLANH